ncbi:MAG TPA: hypothetical protein VH062_02340 [Polyangiaceae bacterium]|jgi:hypothetical protein|nr:hypothetical protein [Polyangiaceae bacterium]
MALLRRGKKTAPAEPRRKEKPKARAKPKSTAAAAPLATTADAVRDVAIFDEIRSCFWEPTEVLSALLGAKYQLTEDEARKRISNAKRTLRRHAVESLKTSKEDLFLRQLEDSGRARRERRWDDARAADRFIMELTGAAAPKKGVLGIANLGGLSGIDPQVAGLLGVMNVDEVEAIIAEGEEVGDDG